MAQSPEYLDTEHRDLDHLLAEVEYLAQRRAFGAAGLRFERFRLKLLEHLREEEDVIYPAYVDATGDPDAMVGRLHEQHAQLETALEAVACSLVQGDYADFCDGLGALSLLLQTHQTTEERLWSEDPVALLPTGL